MNAYAVPQPLAYGQFVTGGVGPGYEEGHTAQVDPASGREVHDKSRIAFPAAPGFLRVGLGREWEVGLQAENRRLALYAHQRVQRGAVDIAWRAGPGLWKGERSFSGSLLVGAGGGVGPVVGLGAGWFARETSLNEVPASVVPQGKIVAATFGVRTPKVGTLAWHPEVGVYRAVGGESTGITAGVGWLWSSP